MTWWDRLKGILKREADDVAEGMSEVGRKLDEALARKEREAAATPAERIDMILEDIEEEDRRFDEIASKVPDRPATPDGPRARVLSEDDVAASPGLQQARSGVAVELVGDEDAMAGVFDFAVNVDLSLSAEQLTRVAHLVEEHALVIDTLEQRPGHFWVSSPSLHHDDVALLAAVAAGSLLEG
ncbi:MAG: hypothetical protein KJP12_00570 [Acidimicrobiia bacterium]|nr:hypothetical protein [Acidimicrobiia bacterium]MBT8213689.1 hypothetical protein [Acidimicrobiia bacterium]NNF69778.1 hypothetical protein [Acidimicrobiia bacterium]NNK91438.1 hypothetical protein [Acidimicrobiia bacterium]